MGRRGGSCTPLGRFAVQTASIGEDNAEVRFEEGNRVSS